MNEVVVHGFPNNVALKEGDIVSIDMGVILNGWHGDHAYTFILGEVSDAIMQLVRVTKESLYKGIEKALPSNRLNDISLAVQTYIQNQGFDVVRDYVGHGVGLGVRDGAQQ